MIMNSNIIANILCNFYRRNAHHRRDSEEKFEAALHFEEESPIFFWNQPADSILTAVIHHLGDTYNAGLFYPLHIFQVYFSLVHIIEFHISISRRNMYYAELLFLC